MDGAGGACVRFRRSLATGNPQLVFAAARELPQVALDDALRICLVLREGDADRYERAAVGWLGRFALESRGVTIAELRLAARALDTLPDQPSEAMEQLQALCLARGVR
ncbi:MAG TPA: hypothetical protein VEF89_23240 [Solirubrobacteraceae bacterium]|nr:hypothetical protein [Solirubrobacteraceae bacterium]